MVRGPLRDRDGIFPILPRDTVLEQENSSSDSNLSEFERDEIPHFDSRDDLPDSPMLNQYIDNVSRYLNKSEEEIINSQPTIDYMRQLGVLKLAIEQNR